MLIALLPRSPCLVIPLVFADPALLYFLLSLPELELLYSYLELDEIWLTIRFFSSHSTDDFDGAIILKEPELVVKPPP